MDWPEATSAQLLRQFGRPAAEAIAALQQIREVEPAMTTELLAALPSDTYAEHLQWRMKSPSSLARKVEDKVVQLGIPPRDAVASVNDIVRYTVVTKEPAELVNITRKTVRNLQRQGWVVEEAQHSYVDGNSYKGLHLTLRRADVACEVQFHSTASLAVKEDTHEDYELERDMRAPREERAAAFRRMVKSSSALAAPTGLSQLRQIGGVAVRVKAYRNRHEGVGAS